MKHVHKIVVKHTVELSTEERAECLEYADELGLAFDNPTPLTLLKRLFRDLGTSAVLAAKKAKELDD